jgi:hypothetical protein
MSDETICCGLFKNVPFTIFEIEKLYDDNDNLITFINENNNNSNNLQNKTIEFYSSRVELANNHFLLRKVSCDKKISVIMTYKNDGDNRILIDGFILTDNKKLQITSFTCNWLENETMICTFR